MRRALPPLLLVGFVIVTFPFWGQGCRARYRDVPQDSQYAKRVGQRCVVLKGLHAHGWYWDDRNVTAGVDVAPFEIGGREITFEVPIPKDTELTITSVRECWNCPSGRISYGVQIPSIPKLAPYPVFARAVSLEPAEVTCSNAESTKP